MEIEMRDGSVWSTDKEYWQKALNLKAKNHSMTMDELCEDIRDGVEQCWNDKKVLTKFGDEDWEREYKDQADLADDCIYAYVRPYLMALIISEVGAETKVVSVGEDGAREIDTNEADTDI